MGLIFFGGLEIGKTDQNAKKQTKNRPKISKSLLTDQSLLKQTDLASLGWVWGGHFLHGVGVA